MDIKDYETFIDKAIESAIRKINDHVDRQVYLSKAYEIFYLCKEKHDPESNVRFEGYFSKALFNAFGTLIGRDMKHYNKMEMHSDFWWDMWEKDEVEEDHEEEIDLDDLIFNSGLNDNELDVAMKMSDGLGLLEIGNRKGITRERVAQIRNQGVAKIKKRLRMEMYDTYGRN